MRRWRGKLAPGDEGARRRMWSDVERFGQARAGSPRLLGEGLGVRGTSARNSIWWRKLARRVYNAAEVLLGSPRCAGSGWRIVSGWRPR